MRGKLSANRFQNHSVAPAAESSRPTVGDIRNAQRSASSRFKSGDVYLPNPTGEAPIDRMRPQSHEAKSHAFGFSPNSPQSFSDLVKGDSGASKSSYRTAELFQLLGAIGDRTAATPYSRMVQIATMRSRDLRPRYFHTSLFSVARIIANRFAPGLTPLPSNEISRFASGIPVGTPSITGNTQFAVPQFSTTKFRIMIHDESGQRFVDVDALGTRSLGMYAFGVTVFALIKEAGYEIDRQRNDNPPLGPGLIDQSIVGVRIIQVRSDDTKNPSNRTVSVATPGAGFGPTAVPIPTGARRVKIYSLDGVAAVGTHTITFATVDPLDTTAPILGSQGFVDFLTLSPAATTIFDIPNSNAILITPSIAAVPSLWSFAFEVTP